MVDFTKNWATIYAAVPAQVWTIVAFLGTCLVAYAIVKFVVEKRKGSGNLKTLLWSVAIGIIAVLPDVSVRILLTVLSGLANIAVNIGNSLS